MTPTGVTPESEICDHYPEEELKTIPVMKENVKEALAFLSKDKDGFFLMYEQGDIGKREMILGTLTYGENYP